MPILIVTLQQTDSGLLAEIERLGSAVWLLAIAAVIVGTLSLAALVASLMTMRSASRLIGNFEKQLNRLTPRAEPLIEKMTALATDARDTSDLVRRRVTDVMDTVADINRSLRDAAHAAEVRVREFSAVVDVVKHEVEEALMDTAATARGIQATTRALRGEPDPGSAAFDNTTDPPHEPEQLVLPGADELEDAPPVRRTRANLAKAGGRGETPAHRGAQTDGGDSP